MAKLVNKALITPNIMANTNPFLRPSTFSDLIAGNMNKVMPTIMQATGKVASASDGASFKPMKPPTKTITGPIEPMSAWANINNQTLG